jgi:nucleotide-binding universal stress UspA family protein
MAIRNIFIPVFRGAPFRTQLDAALQLCTKDAAHINVVFVRPDAAAIAASIPDMLVAAGISVEHIESEGLAAEAEAKAEFEKWRVANGIKSGLVGTDVSSATWRERVGPLEAVVVEVGRLSDLTILARPDVYETDVYRAFDAAVFESGRPALIVPDHLPQKILDHIIVAWNSSLQATRAIAGALPLLRIADQVSVFTAPTHADEAIRDLYLGEQLAWHGIRANYLTPVTENESVGEALLGAAREQQATMLVMGAYTHSRIREMLLGGVTRHILRHADIPALMMH